MFHRRAFSLIELVMVLMIVGIVAAIALPRYFNAIARYRMQAAALRVVADLQLARASARTQGEARTVTFDLSGGALTVSNITPLNRPDAVYRTDFSAEPYRVSLVTADFGGDADLAGLATDLMQARVERLDRTFQRIDRQGARAERRAEHPLGHE